jgi:serine/threonine protein kinase
MIFVTKSREIINNKSCILKYIHLKYARDILIIINYGRHWNRKHNLRLLKCLYIAKGKLILNQRSLSEFQILKQIGEGGFSKVYKVRSILENKDYALKKIEIETEGKSSNKIRKELTSQLKEIKILSSLQNNNIVKYVESWIEVKEGKTKIADCKDGIIINNVVYK